MPDGASSVPTVVRPPVASPTPPPPPPPPPPRTGQLDPTTTPTPTPTSTSTSACAAAASVSDSFSARIARQRQLLRRGAGREGDSGAQSPPLSNEFGDEFRLGNGGGGGGAPAAVSRRLHGPDEEFVESWSKIRLIGWQVSARAVRGAIARGQLLKLGDVKPRPPPGGLHLVRRGETGAAAAGGDWMTVGVLVHKTGVRATPRGQEYVIFRLSDLRGAVANLFLFGGAAAAHRSLAAGSVLLVLNPDVLAPARLPSCLGLRVSCGAKVLKTGASLDLASCAGVGRNGSVCNTAIDSRFGKYCDFHIAQDYLRTKARRMELATGTSRSAPGDPCTSAKRKSFAGDASTRRGSRPLPDAIASQGSYILDENLVVGTAAAAAAGAEAKGAKPKQSAKQENLINHFMEFNSHGASLLRRALRLPDRTDEPPVPTSAPSKCRTLALDQVKAKSPEDQARKKAGIKRLLESSAARSTKRRPAPK